MAPLLIFKVGDALPALAAGGDFEDWIRAGLGETLPVEVVDPRAGGQLPGAAEYAGVVITGSHDMVSARASWSEALAGWLREAVPQGLSVLGICYGHQLLAHALGGSVADHPGGLELGSQQVRLAAAAEDDPLLAGLPQQWPAQLVHRQSVRTLPPGAVLLAGSVHEPHQAFRVGDRVWGVQFHPEFGPREMAAYIDHFAPELGAAAATLRARVVATPVAASLLGRFARLVQGLQRT